MNKKYSMIVANLSSVRYIDDVFILMKHFYEASKNSALLFINEVNINNRSPSLALSWLFGWCNGSRSE